MPYLRNGIEMIPTMETGEVITQLENVPLGESITYKPPGSSISMKMRPALHIDGSIRGLISQIGDGSIITLFDKTPYPTENEDVVCPHFIELKWANGCNFDCAWCYLNGTFRFRPCGKKPYMKDKERVMSHIRQYLEQIPIPTLLNSGELSDSLAFEGTDNAITSMIVPLFKEQSIHKLLILTKSSNVKGILQSDAQDNVIASFSLNAPEVSSRWEKNAPKVEDRIKAAKKLFDSGYTVRLRIDPMVPIDDWEASYRSLIRKIFDNLIPERITLGSLRGLQSTINHSKDKSWVEYLDDRSNWGKKISFPRRAEMYHFILDTLKDEYSFTKVGLCKETIGMWEEIGKDYKTIQCNCIM